MATQIDVKTFTNTYLEMLEETFEKVYGMYLDGGTSLFETLKTINPEMASRPISPDCASVAAQVEHIRFYLEVMEDMLRGYPRENVDWQEIWRTVKEVTPEEWKVSKTLLEETYHRVRVLVKGMDQWESEEDCYGVLAIMVHTAYHLGEIRHALCVLRQ
jgi:hypothetical protein